MKYAFIGEDGLPLDPQGWIAGNEFTDSSATAPIHLDGKVIALVVVKGEESIGHLLGYGMHIAAALNAYEPSRKLLDEIYQMLPDSTSIRQDIRGALGYTPK